MYTIASENLVIDIIMVVAILILYLGAEGIIGRFIGDILKKFLKK